MIYACRNLGEVEELLVPLYKKVTIISELSISKIDVKRIQDFIFKILKNKNNQKVLVSKLWKHYPLSCMTLTVFIAIDKYDGNYWGHLRSATGLEDENDWRKWFFSKVRKKGLPVFDEFGQQKYVSTVLGHAGVPKKSFPGFIHGFLKPSVENGLDAEEAISSLISGSHNTTAAYKLHKGVRDYLVTGGKVAVDFVDRCLQILIETKKDPVNEFRGFLPRRILKEFQAVLLNNQEQLKLSKKEKLAAPRIKLDPYFHTINLDIPIQKITMIPLSKCSWNITINGNKTDSVICDIVPLAEHKQVELIPRSNRFLLDPNSTYEVELLLNNERYRKWTLDTNGVLLFDGNTHHQLNKYLIHEGSYSIVIQKEFQRTDQSVKQNILTKESLHNSWSNHSIYEITPEFNEVLKFQKENESIEIPVFAVKDKATFLQSNESSWGGKMLSFYEVPTVCIPSSTYPDFRKKLSDWIMKIHHEDVLIHELTLSSIKDDIRLVGENFQIDMNKIKNQLPPGKYHVRLIGPLGSDIKLTFTILPESLKVKQLTNPEFPSPLTGFTDKKYELQLGQDYTLTCLAPTDVSLIRTSSKNGVDFYHLGIPQTVSNIEFQCLCKKSDKIFELNLMSKAVTWKTVLNGSQQAENQLLKLTEQDIETMDMRIYIDTANLKALITKKFIRMTVKVIDDRGKAIQNIEKKIRVGSEAKIILEEYKDLIKTQEAALLNIWIELDYLFAKPLRLLTIQKEWKVLDVQINLLEQELHISWKENMELDSRVIRVWDEHHPWNESFEIEIPANANEITLPWHKKESGSYLFEWAIKQEEDFFNFLDITAYPEEDDRCHRWIFQTKQEHQSNPFAHSLLSGRWNRLKSVEFDEKDVFQLLDGMRNYGLVFTNKHLEKYDFWTEALHSHQDQLIESLNKIAINEEIALLIQKCFGIYEWPLEKLFKLPPIITNTILRNDFTNISEKDFGQTRGMMSVMKVKPAEDCHIILQIIPHSPKLISNFSVQHEIVNFIIKLKNDNDFRGIIIKWLRFYERDLLLMADQWKQDGLLTEGSIELLNMRWDMVDDTPYFNFPYFISIVGLGFRLIAKYDEKMDFSAKRLIRQSGKELMQLVPEWFIFDIFFIECSLIKQSQGGVKA